MRTSRLMAIGVATLLGLGLMTITLTASTQAATTPNPEPYSLITSHQSQPHPLAQPAKPSLTSYAPFPGHGSPPIPSDRNSDMAGPNGLNQPVAPHRPTTGGDWDGNGVRYPMVLQDGGIYKMWYSGYEMYGHTRIGYATSLDGINWTKYPANPVLEVGGPGAWDADWLEAAFVIQENPTSYKMWYSAGPACAIGYATSSDGISWTKHAGNPVLTPGEDVWNNDCAIHPFILFEGGEYKIWLLTLGDAGSGQTPYFAYATSPDGINWTWDASNPLFGVTWETWLWRPDVLHLGGNYQMWYSLWDGEGRTSYAAAPDEVTWTKLGGPILSGTSGEWDEGSATNPFVIESSGVYTLWYDNGSAIGVVTSTNGLTWTKFLTGPVLMPGAAGVVIDVNYAHDWVEAWTSPNATLVVTVADAGALKPP